MGLTPAAVLSDGVIDDPWVDGHFRFASDPCVLTPQIAGHLATAACGVGSVLDAVVHAVARDPQLSRFLGMDASLAAIARLDAPRWLVLARADVFLTEGSEHPQVCEINCDTPTGLAECTTSARLQAERFSGALDPSRDLRHRWVHAIRSGQPERARPLVVGLVHAPEFTEDSGHIRLITTWLEEAGITVVRGSPWNLHGCPGDRIGLFGSPIDVLLRHYKTDWWSRRLATWKDDPLPTDHQPLTEQLHLIARAMEAGTVTVVNPWGSAIAQSKRAMAFPWELPELFSADVLDIAKRYLPETRFLEQVGSERLIRERDEWVIKGAYGCEGDEVLLGRETTPEAWRVAVHQAIPDRWIAQRAFRPTSSSLGSVSNHGVYLIGGKPSGIYTRVSSAATGTDARAAGTLVLP